MSLEQDFLLTEDFSKFLGENIIGILPNVDRSIARVRVDSLVSSSNIPTASMLVILSLASEKGVFSEYVDKFESLDSEFQDLNEVDKCARTLSLFNFCLLSLND